MDDFFDVLLWAKMSFPSEIWRIFHRSPSDGENLHSFHLIGSTTVYDSPMTAGIAVAQHRPPDAVDMLVYTQNRCWKVPYSRKFGKGKPMIPFGLDSDDKPHIPKITNGDLASLPHKATAQATAQAPPWLREYILKTCGPYYSLGRIANIARFSLHSKDCLLACRTHRNNHTFVLFDLKMNKMKYGCYSPHCQHIDTMWFEPEL